VRSPVLPGTTENMLIAARTQPGKKAGRDFTLDTKPGAYIFFCKRPKII